MILSALKREFAFECLENIAVFSRTLKERIDEDTHKTSIFFDADVTLNLNKQKFFPDTDD